MTAHIKPGIASQFQLAGISQHVIVQHRQITAAHIGDAAVIIVHIRQRHRLAFLAVKRQIAATGHSGAQVSRVATFPVRIKDKRIGVFTQQIDLGQAIADIKSVIAVTAGQTIVIRSFRHHHAILGDIGSDAIADHITVFIFQHQVTGAPLNGGVRGRQFNQCLRVILFQYWTMRISLRTIVTDRSAVNLNRTATREIHRASVNRS